MLHLLQNLDEFLQVLSQFENFPTKNTKTVKSKQSSNSELDNPKFFSPSANHIQVISFEVLTNVALLITILQVLNVFEELEVNI